MRGYARIGMVLALAAVVAAGCGGTQEKTKSAAAQHVGAAFTVEKPTTIAQLVAEPATYTGQSVRIEGTVKAVCQGRGCWVEVQDAKGATFMAKSLDESILLPKDCAGRKIVVQGVVTALPGGGPAEVAHDATEHAEGVPAHSCPKPEYVVATTGAELR